VSGVHVVVPDWIDDPARPSGGNTYDRQVCRALSARGWSVREHAVAGCWPRHDTASLGRLADAVRRIPDGAVVLLDGLVASAAPEVLVTEACRTRLVILVHMPLGHRPADNGAGDIRMRERAVLSAAAAVITTSTWTRRRLVELYALPAERVHVAEPGVDLAELAPGTVSGGSLLCVAAVTPAKGHDVLVDALSRMRGLPWDCACVGSIDRDPVFVASLGRRLRDVRLQDRVSFTGPLTGAELDSRYAAADVMVLASRAETYGMVVSEALARGLPVVAAEVGGIGEAMGHGADGIRPGLMVPPDDPVALGAALRGWLGDAELRARLRRAACERRRSLPRWSSTTSVIAGVLAGVSR
jgi:glycosyltransferase involved in cell wall biosynthesis